MVMATGTVRCGGASHRVGFDAHGRAHADAHDEDAERALVALGGTVAPCLRVVQAFDRPTNVTMPVDPRFAAYCADTAFVSARARQQMDAWVAASTQGPVRIEALLQRALLDADDAVRASWLLRWLDVQQRVVGPRPFQGTLDLVAHRVAEATVKARRRTLVSWRAGSALTITRRGGRDVVTVPIGWLRDAIGEAWREGDERGPTWHGLRAAAALERRLLSTPATND
jgi:hypothetical protein